jgi:hypothetical protein
MRTKPSELLTRALSIRQPYVEAIFRGTETEEFPSRPTGIRGRVYLYASLRSGDAEYGESLGIPGYRHAALPRGGIVGSVEIVGREWDKAERCFAWKLARPTRYGELFRAIGQPQLAF